MARILVDICHPAHAHFFRHPIADLQARGHEIIVTSRRKEMATDLLDDFNIEHRPLTITTRSGPLGMLSELVRRDLALARVIREIRPACITAIGGIFAAHAGFLTRTPSVVFYDTENAKLQNLLTYPVATRVVAPRCYEGWLPRNAVRYPGYHELSYLHPNRFTPNREIAIANGLASKGDTFLVRTVAWKANHDIGEHGWSADLLRRIVDYLSARGTVVISSEAPMPRDLEVRRYPGDPEHIHHVMAYCRLHIGESATMASESAVLGVPAVYAAQTGRGYTNEQEHEFGLVKNVQRLELAPIVEAIQRFLSESPRKHYERQLTLLDSCADVATFAVGTIEHAGQISPAPKEAPKSHS